MRESIKPSPLNHKETIAELSGKELIEKDYEDDFFFFPQKS